jgi:uncharacterized OB-fold protein
MESKLIFRDYNEALKQDKVLSLKCRACGAIMLPSAMACHQCQGSDLEIFELKTQGRIRTFTPVFVAAEGRESEVPYILVLVELDEGPWLMGNLGGVDPQQADMELIGKKVKMGHKIFPGDKYSAGEAAYPLFTLED